MKSFENKFVVVPTAELASRITRKKAMKGGKYSFYFHFDGGKVVEQRDEIQDYSSFLDNWKLVKDILN